MQIEERLCICTIVRLKYMQIEERLCICTIVSLKCMQIEEGVYALCRVGVGIKSLAAVNHRR